MKTRKDHPGVFVPPPLFYAAVFFAAMGLQRVLPLDRRFFLGGGSRFLGWTALVLCFAMTLPALIRFLLTRNTLVTVLPARSLQTTGIYAISRNPMYVGLALLYTGLACWLGNWWHFILLPLLLLVVQEYIIKREERYLVRRFGQEFTDYMARVRRWL